MTVSVTASGLVTAIGFNAESTLSAIRAGVSGLKTENIWDYESGEYIAGARVALPHWWESVDKLADLLAPAIVECWDAASPVPPEAIPVLIGLAGPDRPLRPADLERQILDLLAQRLEERMSRDSRTISRSQVSALAGVAAAERLITEHRAEACIVAGVDSFLDRWVAAEYFKRRRLLCPSNSNGFSPGEAGAAVLVQPTATAPPGSLDVLSIGFGREVGTIESEEPLQGDGLSNAVGEALRKAGIRLVDAAYRITDLNGEQYKFKEAMIALTRHGAGAVWPRLFELWHPIEYVGEVGAAIGPLALAMALHAGRNGYAPGPIAVCHFSNDDGERAAAITRCESLVSRS
jgi:3-oxoacyl-[acyl-carrier-protein] synthase I